MMDLRNLKEEFNTVMSECNKIQRRIAELRGMQNDARSTVGLICKTGAELLQLYPREQRLIAKLDELKKDIRVVADHVNQRGAILRKAA